ncbi:hypothetical protein EJB05_28920, partial [Eragrostis curvula]
MDTPGPGSLDAASSPPWADLLPDLLREISSRVGTAANYVRFHAVCWSWRDTIPPLDRRPALLPWILSPRDATGHRYARCIFSSNKIRVRDRRWVTSPDDGTAMYWLQTASWTESARSGVDPVTGSAAAIAIPRYPDKVQRWEERAVGVSCADGTIALFAVGRGDRLRCGHGFDAALRRPAGDAGWTLGQRNGMDVPDLQWWRRCPSLTYRHRKMILSYLNRWRIVSPENPAADDDQQWRKMPREPRKELSGGYLVETRGELLWVFVHLDVEFYRRYNRRYPVSLNNDLASALSVSVFVLHEEGSGVPRWVKRDGQSLADRILFLSGEELCLGRCQSWHELWWKPERSRVFKYSFSDAKSEFVAKLPNRWNRRNPFMWVSPRPAIATKQEMRSRAAHFRMYVGNLPGNVDSDRLWQFFSNHGKVADVRIMYHTKTKSSQGFGFVTMMPAKDDEPADIIAKLHGKSLDGRPLQVKLAD